MATSKTSHGVDVIVEEGSDAPLCEHGPTLLFERFFKDKPSRRFYACSACRDRKDCPFFQWEDEKVTNGKLLIQNKTKKKLFGKKNNQRRQLKENDFWCFDCGISFITSESQHEHHQVKVLNQQDLLTPTSLINPKENKKYNAQYFFDEETCNFFMAMIARLNYKHVVCVGTPRLFDLLNASKQDISVMLLDIDSRLEQFYSSKKFQRYNMFNNFFFNAINGKDQLKEFLGTAKPEEILIIIDPPFGGLVNVLAKTIHSLWKLIDDDVMLATMLVFPYFLESHVQEHLDSFQMIDLKVSYTNHPNYCISAKNIRGSPVRIFTNIPADRVALPKDGYRFCKLCQRYVYNENKHCKICKLCTSKDGRTYVHCTKCRTCVKPGRVHCDTCEKCEPVEHVCGKESIGCHICGEVDHKRRNCPKKEKINNRTRKRSSESVSKTVTLASKSKKKRSAKVKIRI